MVKCEVYAKLLAGTCRIGRRNRFSSAIMDALKAEIASKRKALQDEISTLRPTKYMRRADIERMKEEELRAKQAMEENEAAATQKKALVRVLLLLDQCQISFMDGG